MQRAVNGLKRLALIPALLLSAPGVDRRYRISGRPDGLLQRTAEPLS